MEKLEFKVEPEIYENISAGVQKAFVSNVKPSELHKYFILTEENKIDVRYFNEIIFTVMCVDADYQFAGLLLCG